jgi:hypothetical protein
MITLLLLLLAQEPEHMKCTTTGGPVHLGTEKTTVPMKCCPPGFFISDPHRVTDDKGNLICSRDT